MIYVRKEAKVIVVPPPKQEKLQYRIQFSRYLFIGLQLGLSRIKVKILL